MDLRVNSTSAMKQLTNICKKQKCACWWWSLVASCKCLLLPHSARAQITLLHIVWIWWSHLCELLMCMYISAGILCKFFTFFFTFFCFGMLMDLWRKAFVVPGTQQLTEILSRKRWQHKGSVAGKFHAFSVCVRARMFVFGDCMCAVIMGFGMNATLV